MDCRSVDVFPLLTGSQGNTAVEDANRDPLLNDLVGRHLQKHPMDLIDSANPAAGFEKSRIYVVPDDKWSDDQYRDAVLRKIKDQWTGFEPEHYALKDTYQEDAAECFSAHRRTIPCIDWQDDSKRLTPSNWHGHHVYLCHFCPVAATVTTAQRMAKGYYNKQPGEVD